MICALGILDRTRESVVLETLVQNRLGCVEFIIWIFEFSKRKRKKESQNGQNVCIVVAGIVSYQELVCLACKISGHMVLDHMSTRS